MFVKTFNLLDFLYVLPYNYIVVNFSKIGAKHNVHFKWN